MKKLIFLFFVSLFIVINIKSVKANSNIELCVVYDKNSYNKGEIINLSFDLPRISNLFEVIIRIEYDQKKLMPISNDDKFFQLNNHSIFDEFMINKKINENIIYGEMIKNDVLDGYYSSYKNNLCTILFSTLSNIDNITEFFNNFNIQIFLFDINHNLINYKLNYVKSVDAGFIKDKIEIEVNSLSFDITEYFFVYNRKASDYELLEEKNVNISEIGSQIYQIGLFDKITGKYLSYSVIIEIYDNLPPLIKGYEKIDVLDVEMENIKFIDYISVTDNYDHDVSINVTYYNKKKEIINDYLECFKKDFIIYVEFTAVDSSLNKSDGFIIEFNLIDTIAPVVVVDDIFINDYNLDDFDITDLIIVNDNLDINPKIIISFYNNNYDIIDDYKKYITITEECFLEVYSIDKNNNISDKIISTINLIDTTCPSIIYEENTYIDDYRINDIEFISLIEINDNDKRSCNTFYDLLVDDVVVDKICFINSLFLNKDCFIKYYVYDYSLNYSECKLRVILNDTSAPLIYVNVENNGVYKKIDSIEYEVIDNFDCIIEIKVLLNNEEYLGGSLSNGEYNLLIECVDASGNESFINYNFIVSDKSFVSNLIDGSVRINKNIILYIVIGCSLIITIINMWCSYKIKKKQKES